MFQTAINLTDTPKTEYNGWSDWTTWNCALWISGDEGFYSLAKELRDYGEFINCIKEIYFANSTLLTSMDKTPDGAKWEEADFGEMQEMIDEL